MKLSVNCVECLVRRQVKAANEQPCDERREKYMRDCLRAILDAPEDAAAPVLVSRFKKIFAKYYHNEDIYADIKKRSNEYVLSKVPDVRRAIDGSNDRLLTALKFARTGNYIDFGALGDSVSNDVLDALLLKAQDDDIDVEEYGRFLRDLGSAKKLLYITDNAGEVILDALFIEELKRSMPSLDICVAVRGAPALNDATEEDARAAGIDRLARIIPNGSGVPGTYIPEAGEAMRRELETADVILSKGQGNFETMFGCGLNVYYIFLCKCDWFTRLFRVPKLAGMFANENRLKIYNA